MQTAAAIARNHALNELNALLQQAARALAGATQPDQDPQSETEAI